MKTWRGTLVSIAASPLSIPFGLLAVAVLAYGLLLGRMGFYWDDLPISWIRYQLGPDAMRLYFSTSRPVWGELYQLTTRILPQVPLYWQIFALFWRWLGAVLVWAVLRELWPGRPRPAITVSLLFLLYPGFNQQWISFLYSHFFIVLCFFLFSLLLMLWSFRSPRWSLPLAAAALLFSALNLWMMEYFFFLEMIRPLFIYAALARPRGADAKPVTGKALLLAAGLPWLPYLSVWLADVLYRMFVFTNLAYQNSLLDGLRAAPLSALAGLARSVLRDLWRVSAEAWMQILHFPNPAVEGPRTVLLYAAIVLIAGAVTVVLLAHARAEATLPRFTAGLIGLGLVAMLTAGGPYWLAMIDIALGFPANRFTLSFMLGVSMLLGGLLELLPARPRLALAALLVALAAGRQALWADAFSRDWATHKSMFWQMTWRAPGLKPDTIVLVNEGALDYYADNSIGAALNWIYDPANRGPAIHYVFFYPNSRLGGSLPGLAPGLPVNYAFLIGTFAGNTSQSLAFYYQPPGCLRLLDPEIDPENRFIPDGSEMRTAARLSSPEWITAEPAASMPDIYGPEPAHGWCYYFEQADLARQLQEWPRVAALGDAAFRLDDYPNDPLERFVFIEGYAHAGDWVRARDLSLTSFKVSPEYVGPLLCRLWDRLARQTPASPDKETALAESRAKFGCLP